MQRTILQDITDLLKYGAYILREEDQTETREYDEEDIDAILERATVISTPKDTPTHNNMFSVFSKASFVSEEATNIRMDDPDFWEKV